MKIAILLSGRLTSYDKHYDNIIKNLVPKGAQVDFYAGLSKEPINDELVGGFKKLYKPKTIKKSSQPLLKINWDKVKSNKEMELIKKNVMFMWRNRDTLRRVVKKFKPQQYDWIISTRPDVYYSNKLNYSQLDPNSINIPQGADYNGYQDKIAIGKKEIMLKYLNLYNNMEKYLEEDKKAINPEPLLKYHLKKQNVPVVRILLSHKIFPKVSNKDKQKNN